ncbi:MAG: SAF domain-containing protein [Schaalia odontolytica]
MKRVSASVSIPTRTPGKVDRRFIIGVVLVIASVIAFSVLSGLLRGGTRVYTVTSTIAPGDVITADNVREVVLRVDDSVYAPTSEAPMGSVATRQLAPGQILMRSDIAQGAPENTGDTVRLAVTVTTGLPDGVADGTKIRLWSVPTRTQAQGTAPAREIEGSFTFVRTIDAPSSSQTRRGQRIEILANSQSLPVLLAAQSSSDGLAAVPVGAS